MKSIGRKLVISDSHKIQPLLNASRVLHTISAGSLKKRQPSKKDPKNILFLVIEVHEPKTSPLVKLMKVKQLHIETPKFKI